MAVAIVGRKRQNPICNFLDYDGQIDRNKCLVVEGDKICGVLLKGKNPTTLANCEYLEQVQSVTVSSPEEANVQRRLGGSNVQSSETTIMDCFTRRPGCWSVNANEHNKREEALVNIFTDSGLSTRLCQSSAFKNFCFLLEPKFKLPGTARVNNLIGAKMEKLKEKLKGILQNVRKVTICVDVWTKRGLAASFMGVSACFYHPPGGQVYHAMFNLHRWEHPHPGESIARCIRETLRQWDIVDDKVLLVVTDNGSNIVKAVRVLRDRSREPSYESTEESRAQPVDSLGELWVESDTEETDEEDEENGETGDLGLDLPDDEDNNRLKRMPCLAHTLQLTLKAAIKHPNADSLISKARKLVFAVRKSSVANEALIKNCGQTLVRDCCTRWNSTFDMLKRLLEIRPELNQVLEDLGMDTLLTNDWAKLENLVKLLEPFAIHTDQLQSDSQSLSQVVPCLLNLEAHLLTITAAGRQLAKLLLKSLRERFAAILSPDSLQFDGTPAAACLLDPSVSLILQAPDMVPLRRAAQCVVQNLVAQFNPTTTSQNDDIGTQVAPLSTYAVLQKYCFLAPRMVASVPLTNEPDEANSLLTEIKKFSEEVKTGMFNETPMQFWKSREAVYPKLAPVALDLVSAPASQAFVERIFSVYGLLTSGLRNRTTTSLEQRVFLKINKKLLCD